MCALLHLNTMLYTVQCRVYSIVFPPSHHLVPWVFNLLPPVTHAQLPGEDNSSNALHQQVSANDWSRAFWTLLMCYVLSALCGAFQEQWKCPLSSLGERNTCSRRHDHPEGRQRMDNKCLYGHMLIRSSSFIKVPRTGILAQEVEVGCSTRGTWQIDNVCILISYLQRSPQNKTMERRSLPEFLAERFLNAAISLHVAAPAGELLFRELDSIKPWG